MRRTIGTLASTLALAAALSACGGDPEPQFEAEPSAEPTASSPSASAEPEAWEERSDDGAVAFVEHWIDVFDQSKEDGDTDELAALSAASCVTCENFIEMTNDIYANGGSVESRGWTVESISEPVRSADSTLVAVNVLQSPQKIRRGTDSEVETFEGGNIDLAFTLRWRQGAWSVQAVDSVQ